MNNISNESKISFAGTIIFHVLLLLIAFFMSINNKPQVIEFVELSLTSIEVPAIQQVTPILNRQTSNSKVEPAKQSGPTSAKSIGGSVSDQTTQSKTSVPTIVPPRYSLTMDNDIQPVKIPSSNKLDVSDTRENYGFDKSLVSNQERENFSRNNNSNSGALPTTGGSVPSDVSVPGNSNIGKEIKSFSVAWQDGGIRNKTSGNMPRYPENSNKEVQIKVQVTVEPDGSITRIIPLQKADHAFENAVIIALKTWKFEKLRQGVPEESQIGIITFNFKLE